MAPTVEIKQVDPRQPELAHLFAAHLAHGAAHYPSESNHALDAETLAKEGTDFFVALLDQDAVGMAALVPIDAENAELKSMHVLQEARGNSIARRLLATVLDSARSRSFARMYLETGSKPASETARALYAKAGFSFCPPFGAYIEDPESVFMTLALTPDDQSAKRLGVAP